MRISSREPMRKLPGEQADLLHSKPIPTVHRQPATLGDTKGQEPLEDSLHPLVSPASPHPARLDHLTGNESSLIHLKFDFLSVLPVLLIAMMHGSRFPKELPGAPLHVQRSEFTINFGFEEYPRPGFVIFTCEISPSGPTLVTTALKSYPTMHCPSTPQSDAFKHGRLLIVADAALHFPPPTALMIKPCEHPLVVPLLNKIPSPNPDP
mmetsp:Transcript_34299/g.107455  ORF Transcript_34299/g.107455 Transcript_34299/m.107455 type:complete len:208 (+) Transcript_34299:1667-2290(+)